jgi:hypothetical protein
MYCIGVPQAMAKLHSSAKPLLSRTVRQLHKVPPVSKRKCELAIWQYQSGSGRPRFAQRDDPAKNHSLVRVGKRQATGIPGPRQRSWIAAF